VAVDSKQLDVEIEGGEIVSPRIIAASFFESLFTFLRQTEVHDRTNSIFERCLDSLLQAIQALRRIPGFESIEITFRGEQIYINDVRMKAKVRQFHKHRFLLRFMRNKRLGALRFPENLERESLLGFLWVVAAAPIKLEDPIGWVNTELAKLGIQGYGVESLQGFHLNDDKDRANLADMEVITLVIHEKLRLFAEICFDNLESSKSFDLPPRETLIKDLSMMAEEDLLQVFRSNLMKRRERPLGYLAADVCVAGIAWGRSLGLPGGVIVELAESCLSHALLYVARKDCNIGRISNDEALRLFDIVGALKEVWPLSELQKLSLLEFGQPYGQSGIYDSNGTKCYAHFFSRMIRILAHFRIYTHYSKGTDYFLPDEAMAKMLSLKGEYDSTLLKLFVNWMGIYPVGTLVKLRSGEVCQVFVAGGDPLKFQRPIVSVLKDSYGRLMARPVLMDLAEMNDRLGVYKKTILKSLSLEEAAVPDELLKSPPVSL